MDIRIDHQTVTSAAWISGNTTTSTREHMAIRNHNHFNTSPIRTTVNDTVLTLFHHGRAGIGPFLSQPGIDISHWNLSVTGAV
jgi:hypothetical protein